MTTPKRALITGITGQDGSYLSEFLLDKGYEVHGIIRRSSSINTSRIDHLYQDPHLPGTRLFLHYGDLTDGSTLRRILEISQPDEVYNLGAQSHVRVSFDEPQYTVDTVALGTLRLLEAIREYQQRTGRAIRFYQAGSSEMFGLVQEVPQTEKTPFYPRSPYACAKVYAHWQTINYREAYNLFACNGILFNHECVTAETPVFIKENGLIDLLPIADLVPHGTDASHGHRYTTDLPQNQGNPLYVWDAQGWTAITCMTATWNGGKQPKPVHQICAQGAVVSATSDHVVFTATGEQRSADIQLGTQLQLIDLPPPPEQIDLTTTEAWLLGLITAEGYITPEGTVQITNQDQELLRRAISHWRKVTGGDYHSNSPTQLYLTGANDYGRYLRNQLYTHYNYKRIPKRVLNADYHARLAFLEGFNGKSTPCTYEFQSFKTDSPVLSAGLYWLALTTLNRRPIICPEKTYYQIHLNSPNPAVLPEVVKNEAIDYQGWLFDLATVSGTFHAGIGQAWIHNSPRRGETFVTRKITRAIANIIYKKQNKLYLGNLDAKRDWGYAKDYVEAMWLMLQQDQPDDYVIATGETHSVREFLEVAFNYVNLRWEDYVEIDPRYFRPTEVELLIGDASKAKVKLGWQPRVTFQELVKIMVDADLAAVGKAP